MGTKTGASREPARHGAQGWLDALIDLDRLDVPGTGHEEHRGLYRYVGIVNGHLAFAPATVEHVLYLLPGELVSFRPTGEGSG